MKKLNIFFLISTLFIVSGCSSKDTIDIDTTPKMQVPKKIKTPVKKKGSLYSRKGASLFSDKKDLQIGDIIQVLIEETVENESKNSRDMSKTNTSNLSGGVFAPSAGVTSTAGTARKLNSGVGLGFSSNSTGSFKGSSKQSTDEEFTTKVSAIIEQTYQNGNYFIKGSKEMLINGQKQIIKISGVIRPYDISPENTVYSYQLANLKVMYEKNGEEMDSIRKPWGTKLIETIWPF